jgi:hypothetical protein
MAGYNCIAPSGLDVVGVWFSGYNGTALSGLRLVRYRWLQLYRSFRARSGGCLVSGYNGTALSGLRLVRYRWLQLYRRPFTLCAVRIDLLVTTVPPLQTFCGDNDAGVQYCHRFRARCRSHIRWLQHCRQDTLDYKYLLAFKILYIISVWFFNRFF